MAIDDGGAVMPAARAGLRPHEIVSPLGAGGFGEFYKTRDTRLDRTVAIKILPSTHPELTSRFERGAKAIAALRIRTSARSMTSALGRN